MDYLHSTTAIELAQALEIVGFRPGERFEVAAKDPKGAFRAGRFTDVNAAANFLDRFQQHDRYLGLNSIRLDAEPPKGRARRQDVAWVERLLIDLDPTPSEPEDPKGIDPAKLAAAEQLEKQVLAILADGLGVRPVVVSSGRGRQIWLRHEALAPGDEAGINVRERLLKALAVVVRVEGAEVDDVTHDAPRLARLPGSVNLKTGARAAIIDRGDGRAAGLADLKGLVEKLEAQAGTRGPQPRRRKAPRPQQGADSHLFDPADAVKVGAGTAPPIAPGEPAVRENVATTETAGIENEPGAGEEVTSANPAALKRLRNLLATLRELPDALKWVGAAAARKRIATAARDAVPSDDALLAAYDGGVAAFRRGGRVARPIDENSAKRLERALESLPRRAGNHMGEEDEDDVPIPGLEIARMIRRTAGPGRGARIDLVLISSDREITLVGLDGNDLSNYDRVRARALEEGLVLARVKNEKSRWLLMLEKATSREEVERPVPGEELDDVLDDEVRRVLGDCLRGETAADLDAGKIVEREGCLLVKYRTMFNEIRRALPDDPFDRADLVRVARRLRLQECRPSLADGTRAKVWSFPVAVLDEEEATS